MGQCLEFDQQQRKHGVMRVLGAIAGSVISLGVFATDATAARLQSWRFDASANRLEFATDETIVPRVQLLPNPVRLVVDLPGVRLDRPTLNQGYSAAVRSIRIGQFDAQTARIVVELSPGYTVDPQQVKVNGNAGASWSINLPTPQLVQNVPDSSGLGTPTPVTPNPNTSVLTPPPSRSVNLSAGSAESTLEDIWITKEGLFLKTQKAVTSAQVTRSRNRREIFVDLTGAVVSTPLVQNAYKISYYGIQRVSVRQLSTQPSVVRVTLRLDRNSPDWFASTSRFGGVMLLPNGGATALVNGRQPSESISLLLGGAVVAPASINSQGSQSLPPLSGNSQAVAMLQNIALGGSQLLIQADRPVYYSTGWDGPRYRITVRGAQWSTNIRSPQIGFGSAITDISLRQEGQNATILVTPSPGIRFGSISRSGSQNILLGFNRLGDGGGSAANPLPNIVSPNSTFPNSGISTPTLPPVNGRRVVVIDPGHGGTDPGAVGIGGLRETDIVLPISLEVVRLLQQQGLQVYLTRADESREVNLPPRVALAKQVRADVFVSIHANSINLSRPDINGTEAYFAPGAVAGKELAQTILNSILRNVNIRSRGLHSARFYVVRNTTMPATLIETGFVTGAEDAPKLRDPNFQRQMAAAIAQGIIEFLNRR
jgi:N-acetylmuramoyl-L-alanine amidase